MTVVRLRSKTAAPARAPRRPTLEMRFPVGRQVQVTSDYHDARYRERLGVVVDVSAEPEQHYSGGRVGVRLAIDELHRYLFSPKGTHPKTVWFSPSHLEKL